MSTLPFSKTPTVTVTDNRGLTVRDITYHRHPDRPDSTTERVTRHLYDAPGFLKQSADPRLHHAGLANFSYRRDLAGGALHTVSADAGSTLFLSDAARRPFMLVSATGMTSTFQYEKPDLPGRLLMVAGQVSGESVRVMDRYVYAAGSDTEKALNLAGVCICHYDTAGLVQTNSIALTGGPLSVTRRLLKDADNPDIVADWQGPDAPAWNALLAVETYTSLNTSDATGAVLTVTDAKGNTQRVACDVAGRLSGSWLTLKGGTEQIIVKSVTYSAAGQKLREEHGNGVVTLYTYEAETLRLVGMKTERPTGHKSGAKVLQDLRYDYDPVGNVLAISNDAEESRFWRNQKVVPENTYVYDSLYQLVSATGREMANAGQQGRSLPVTVPLPTDNTAYTNYNRTYTYDDAGNLTQICHNATATNNTHTTDITVSDHSNRAVLSTLTKSPAQVDALFTAGGQQKQLLPGQNLAWTPRSELLKVTPVERDGDAADRESYRYDAGSQRILKVSVQKTSNSMQTQQVLYLPELELRTAKNGEAVKESLQIITVGDAGRAQVRVLHWESGMPAEISNDQMRYCYDNLTESSQLELDGDGNVISMEEYYPYGGTAVWGARSMTEAGYKTLRYSGKERDVTGLYYYGHRYYQPWIGRWLSVDPAGTVDGLNLFRMVRNNPETLYDNNGLEPKKAEDGYYYHVTSARNLKSIIKRGFIPQGSPGPTLSKSDLLKRQQGTVRSIYNQVASIVNKGVMQKNKIPAGSFIMPDEFWEKFHLEASDIVGDNDVGSIDIKLKKAIDLSVASLDKTAFKNKPVGLKTVDIDKKRQGVLDDMNISNILMQKATLMQKKEAENTRGYIHLAATRDTLEKYASAFKSQSEASSNEDEGNGLIILAINESVFPSGHLEEDMQEPDSAGRYQGGVKPDFISFVNKQGEVIREPGPEMVLDYASAIKFIRNKQRLHSELLQ